MKITYLKIPTAIKQTLALFTFAIFAVACNGFGSASVSTSTAAVTKSAQLTWTAGTGVITGYKIEQSTDNTNFTQVETVGNTTSAAVTGLYQGSTYYFRVKAYNAGGESSASAVASVLVPPAN
jgi:hypothetical protein